MSDKRRCIGSAKFGIEAHDAPPGDFPAQPSQKDGLGRMCKAHWNQYVSALGKARRAAATAGDTEPTVQSQAAARVATKRVARVAIAPKPEPNGATSESPAVKVRRAKLVDRIVAAGGIGTDAGQRILEAAGTASARARSAQLDQMLEADIEGSIA